MFCGKCGRQLSENTRFCSVCGSSVNESDLKPEDVQQPRQTSVCTVTDNTSPIVIEGYTKRTSPKIKIISLYGPLCLIVSLVLEMCWFVFISYAYKDPIYNENELFFNSALSAVSVIIQCLKPVLPAIILWVIFTYKKEKTIKKKLLFLPMLCCFIDTVSYEFSRILYSFQTYLVVVEAMPTKDLIIFIYIICVVVRLVFAVSSYFIVYKFLKKQFS